MKRLLEKLGKEDKVEEKKGSTRPSDPNAETLKVFLKK
jgi:hypothetical protein